MVTQQKSRLSSGKVIGLGVANGILAAAALATTSPAHYLAVAVGVGAFITLTFVLCSRWRAAKQ
jgi:hypothetical protein